MNHPNHYHEKENAERGPYESESKCLPGERFASITNWSAVQDQQHRAAKPGTLRFDDAHGLFPAFRSEPVCSVRKVHAIAGYSGDRAWYAIVVAERTARTMRAATKGHLWEPIHSAFRRSQSARRSFAEALDRFASSGSNRMPAAAHKRLSRRADYSYVNLKGGDIAEFLWRGCVVLTHHLARFLKARDDPADGSTQQWLSIGEPSRPIPGSLRSQSAHERTGDRYPW